MFSLVFPETIANLIAGTLVKGTRENEMYRPELRKVKLNEDRKSAMEKIAEIEEKWLPPNTPCNDDDFDVPPCAYGKSTISFIDPIENGYFEIRTSVSEVTDDDGEPEGDIEIVVKCFPWYGDLNIEVELRRDEKLVEIDHSNETYEIASFAASTFRDILRFHTDREVY